VADAHFGKAVSFRKLGVPVPRGTTAETLAKLGRALADTGAAQVVFLGDFLHSARSHARRHAGRAAAGATPTPSSR
jgi:metallophosphoesterase superfamily enzyme